MDKKKKIAMGITVGMVAFILILVMSMQFKVVYKTDIAEIDGMRKVELETELASIKAMNREINANLDDINSKIEEYQNSSETSESSGELLKSELEKSNRIAGLTDVIGEGIIMTIKDTETTYVSADDLILLINDLKEAGAEAISVNGQRIMVMSDIVYINGAFIKINGERVLSPYVIKAIGNQSHLESILIGKGGYGDRLKELGYDISVEKYEEIKIEKYNKDIVTKYIR